MEISAAQMPAAFASRRNAPDATICMVAGHHVRTAGMDWLPAVQSRALRRCRRCITAGSLPAVADASSPQQSGPHQVIADPTSSHSAVTNNRRPVAAGLMAALSRVVRRLQAIHVAMAPLCSHTDCPERDTEG